MAPVIPRWTIAAIALTYATGAAAYTRLPDVYLADRPLADRAVWMRVNRAAGYAAVGFGAVLVAVGILVAPGPAQGPLAGAAGLASAAAVAFYAARQSRV